MQLVSNSIFSGLVRYFVRHGTAANLLLAVMIVLGLVAISKIRAQFFPDVVIETINVSVKWPGAGSEDIDNSIVSLLEPVLISLDSVDRIQSVSREGAAKISIDFLAGSDMAKSMEDVKGAVDSVQNFPENMDEIKINRRIWRDRVTNVVISGDASLEQLSKFANEFSNKLFRQGVSKVEIKGINDPIIRVLVNQKSLIKYKLSLSNIAKAIGAEAEERPAGEVSSSATRLRTGVAKKSVDEIRNIIVTSSSDGSNIIIGDLAELDYEGLGSSLAYFKDQKPAVVVRVDRNVDGDAIKIQRLVQETADEMQITMPKGVFIELSSTRAEAITNRLNILLKNGIQGLSLVIALLLIFLNVRTAFWVAVGIPAAMMAALALMYFVGLTLNMISLFALILCLGIVVDDAIVVGEHADFRARKYFEEPEIAAENSAIRMGMPVFTATLTTILAFGALVVIGGRFGSLIADIPFTVIVVLIASLVECFLILPNHMVHALKNRLKAVSWYDLPSYYFNLGFAKISNTAFRSITKVSISLRYPLIAGAFALLAVSASLLISGEVKWRFFNAPETGRITGNIAMLPLANRDDTLEMLSELERAIIQVGKDFQSEHSKNPVTFVLTEVGGTSGRGISGTENKDKDQLGSVSVELIDADLRPYSSYAVIGALQDEVRRHPLLETLSFRNWASGPGSDSLSVDILGSDPLTLKNAAEFLKGQLSSFSEVSGLEDSQPYDKNELILQLTPFGSSLGFTIDMIGSELYARLNGIQAAIFPDGTKTSKVIVSLNDDDLKADFLAKTYLNTPEGGLINLGDIVTVSSKNGFASIRRENGVRTLSVTADLSEDDPGQAAFILTTLRNKILPSLEEKFGVSTELGGLAEQEKSFLNDALIGFSLCILGIFLALTWVFQSWFRPLVIMAIIPFGFIGAIWGHYAWGVPLSMFSVIGLIGMTGIIINDSIILISTIDEYSKDRGVIPSIIDATVDRLRAVLLTTLTTVIGLMPLLYEASRDAQFLKPTVITLVYGLGFGFFIVLFLVPAFVAIQLDFYGCLRSLRRLSSGKHFPRRIKLYVFLSVVLLLFSYSIGFGTLIFNLPEWSLLELLLPNIPIYLSSSLSILISMGIILITGIVMFRTVFQRI